MKVTIVDKGEGWVSARFDAVSVTEKQLMSMAAPVELQDVYLSITCAGSGENVNFGSFSVPTHSMLQAKVKGK